MEAVFLGFESAIEYWRAVGAGIAPTPEEVPLRRISGECNLEGEILEAIPELPIAGRGPIHVMISDKSRAHSCGNIVYHTCSQMLPAGSFCKITDRVLVASPALCLLHAAQRTKPAWTLPLLELCMEFLGGYSLCDGVPRGFMQHRPFLSMAALAGFSQDILPHTRGMLLLEQALGLVRPDSWSPRETAAFLMLTLPGEMGGYGLPKPELNHQVDFGRDAREFTDKQAFYLDFYWEGTRVAFEYDGGDHLDPRQIAEDKMRRNLLAAMGYRVIVVEKSHLSDARLLSQQIGMLAQLLGFELGEASREVWTARRKLRSHLLNPSHHGDSTLTRPITLLPAN